MPLSLEKVQQHYGEHGVTTVTRNEQRAKEIASHYREHKSKKGVSNPGPVLSSITDPMTGQTYFGQNFKRGETRGSTFEDFQEGLPDVLKQRLETYTPKLKAGETKGWRN
jgi:hypothetical protein